MRIINARHRDGAGAEGTMENFTALFGAQADPPPPPAALGFGPGKPPPPPPPPANEGAASLEFESPYLTSLMLVSGTSFSSSHVHSFDFSLCALGSTELTGSTNLITHYNLEHAYNKFCGKKVKEKLSNFLPDLPGMIDLPGSHDNSSLRSLIEKPPILGGSFNPITGTMLAGFRLHTGPVRALLGSRLMHMQPPKKKSKQKHKQSRSQDPVPPETPSDSDHKKKKKKKEEDPERKRKKKEKKKKKNRHSPEHPGMGSSQASSSSSLR
ncbi:hypothetical protein K5549_000882 [Capra hircus]|nr:hypothetical protein K5549_000882 [Capra hircus]